MEFYDNGDKYDGQWEDNVPYGNGILKKQRIGIYDYANGDKYEGDFKNGEKEGNGINFFLS